MIYLGDQVHSSLARACRIAGFRPDEIRTVPTGEDFRLRTDGLGPGC